MHLFVTRHLFALAAASVLAALPAIATAHVELATSTPAAGANVETAPDEVVLTFDGELDPDGSSFSVHDHDGAEVGSGEVDLAIADRNVLRGAVSITEPGVYTVEYSVLGADGHEIEGSFSFGYATDEAIPEGGDDDGLSHENPDTALPRPALPLVTITGVLLLVSASLAIARRAAVR